MIDVDVSSQLGDFSLSAKFTVNGGITAIFGRSGAGKSSLIRMIAGLSAPDRGRIALGERVVFDRAASINVPVQQRGVGMVFQDARLFPHMSVERNLLYSQWAAGRHSAVGLGEIAELLGISHLLKRRPHGLSGGEKQRVAIGRALLSNPQILVLDEPLASLDASRKAEILPYLLKLKNEFGIPMLYVSHSLGEIEQLADTLVLLDAGTVMAHGPIAQMLSNLELPQLASGPDAAHCCLPSWITMMRTGRSLSLVWKDRPCNCPVCWARWGRMRVFALRRRMWLLRAKRLMKLPSVMCSPL